MKRSEINAVMRQADEFIRAHGFRLPPFAYWTPEEWRARDSGAREIVEHHLGWDITDFGSDAYERVGLFLFTVRNGVVDNLKTLRGKLYAEKIMVVGVDQITPLHFHWLKTEDIINRGGGNLVVQLYNSTAQDGLDKAEIQVSTDGVERVVPAGGKVVLGPGESITLQPRLYHTFWGEGERVLVGEVSSVNDDNTDNRFFEPVGRFPSIQEDEAPLHLLVNDYSQYWKG